MASENNQSRRKRPWIVAAVLALIVVAAAPLVISKTSLRDAVLQAIVGDPNLRVSSSGASFAWFSPLSIDDLNLESNDGSVSIAMARLRAERSWLSLWLSSPEIGHIEVERPRVEIVVSDQSPAEDAMGNRRVKTYPTISVALKDASLVLREQGAAEPVIDVADLDVRLHTEQRTEGSVLIVQPIKLAQNTPLTAEACNEGLQLVAPVLSDEVSIEGEFSFELTKMQLALGAEGPNSDSDKSQIEGIVTLHHVTGGLKNETTRRLAMFAAELLELGEVPDRFRLTEDAELAFRLTGKQISHEGMAMFFPELTPGFSIRTSGSVALDESLNLQVVFQIPLALLNETPLAHQLTQAPLQLRITGTIDQPMLELPKDQAWVSQIQERLASPDVSAEEKDLADRIMKVLQDLLEHPAQNLSRRAVAPAGVLRS